MQPSSDLPISPPLAPVPLEFATPTATATAASHAAVPGNRGVKIRRACTILRSAADLYDFWRNPENLQQVIRHPTRIRRISAVESEWSTTLPIADTRVDWTSLIINDHPQELIAWQSKQGAGVPNAGSVRFTRAPGDEGTEVVVSLEYDPPGGTLGAWLAKFTGEEPGQQVSDTLRRLKALMEAGEISTIEGQPVGEPQLSKRRES